MGRPVLSRTTTQSSVWVNAGDCTNINCTFYLDFRLILSEIQHITNT